MMGFSHVYSSEIRPPKVMTSFFLQEKHLVRNIWPGSLWMVENSPRLITSS